MNILLARAPGKLVLWGEYAVMAGAPAAVMAVDRWASVQLDPTENFWRISASGFAGPGHVTYTSDPVHSTTAALLNTALTQLGCSDYPSPFRLHTDTSGFYVHTQKLGLGSSAAVCVATYVAVCELLGKEPRLEEAINIHRHFQGGAGSGMDVATSWTGGMVRFQDGQPSKVFWPRDLVWMPVWSGTSASTVAHLEKFSRYRNTSDQSSLRRLAKCSESLFAETTLDGFADYTDALRALDHDGNLGIYTSTHTTLARLAADMQMVFKPCGAGGGDFGIAIGDASQVEAFAATITSHDCQIIPLETANHGVSVQ